MNETKKIILTANTEKQRIDIFLTKNCDLSRSRIKSLSSAGNIFKNNKIVTDISKKTVEGDIFIINIPPVIAAIPQPQNIPLDIIYEDINLIVVNKQANLTVHPAIGNYDGTLVNALLYHTKDSLSGIGGVARPGIVHRLDKNTSGLMVVAKDDITHQHLSKQLADRSLTRIYNGLVWGLPKPIKGTIEGNIGRHPKDRKKMAIVTNTGKYAITHYSLIKTFSLIKNINISLMKFKLETGRTHQIRVHMSYNKIPLISDPTYGSRLQGSYLKKLETSPIANIIANIDRQMLHATEIKFIHPILNKEFSFKTKLPNDMQELINNLNR